MSLLRDSSGSGKFSSSASEIRLRISFMLIICTITTSTQLTYLTPASIHCHSNETFSCIITSSHIRIGNQWTKRNMDDNKRIKAKEIKLITVFVQYTSYIITFIKFRSLFKKTVAVRSFTQIVWLY